MVVNASFCMMELLFKLNSLNKKVKVIVNNKNYKNQGNTWCTNTLNVFNSLKISLINANLYKKHLIKSTWIITSKDLSMNFYFKK